MSGIEEYAETARAVLHCDATDCAARWESEIYRPKQWRDEARAAAPAFREGWRLFVGARTRRTYCPKHGPKTPMRELFGPGRLPS